ncbi:peptide chain release factor N(5)-glutamine methyltransferase [Jannaschia donghaensis]|uniref:Release factor glutamine methyltransferase n=1 Tax=Jannaschia donghaensis TaxID=420998 RepID=A0A0M6YIQ9_9RHOB|nr:Release factor glutamine methyltransferase [Jannaschia donghaensis]
MDDAGRRLSLAGVPDPLRDVSALLDAAGAGSLDELPPDVAARFERLVQRRVRREPVSHLTGRRAFWMHDFIVTPDVLDPRPDTETLVEAALSAPFETVLDLGTGSGCILLSLLYERPRSRGTGTDISDDALAIARRNSDVVGVADRVIFLQSDWLADVTGMFDLIVSNPPYISTAEMADLSPEVLHEPRLALTPGGDGLDAYRTIARTAPPHLMPGGRLMVEIGAAQAEAVSGLLADVGLRNLRVIPDINGKSRVVSGEKPH